MEDHRIAVGGMAGISPVLPYIGHGADIAECARLARLYATAALVRCGFDVIDISSPPADPHDLAYVADRNGCDGAILFSAARFGSGRTFNDVSGASVSYCGASARSRTLAEDICVKISHERPCAVGESDALCRAPCPAVTVNLGYATNFDDARMMLDPDYARTLAEHTAIGLCEYRDMPYVGADEVKAYPLLCAAATGKRGKKIKLLQALLCANGYQCAVDGVYGRVTDGAIKAFCAGAGIPFDGVTSALWRELVFPCLRDVNAGSAANKDVLYIQRKLRAKLYPVPVNGLLCEQTVRALNLFLSENGQTVRASLDRIPVQAIKPLKATGGGRPRLI